MVCSICYPEFAVAANCRNTILIMWFVFRRHPLIQTVLYGFSDGWADFRGRSTGLENLIPQPRQVWKRESILMARGISEIREFCFWSGLWGLGYIAKISCSAWHEREPFSQLESEEQMLEVNFCVGGMMYGAGVGDYKSRLSLNCSIPKVFCLFPVEFLTYQDSYSAVIFYLAMFDLKRNACMSSIIFFRWRH